MADLLEPNVSSTTIITIRTEMAFFNMQCRPKLGYLIWVYNVCNLVNYYDFSNVYDIIYDKV